MKVSIFTPTHDTSFLHKVYESIKDHRALRGLRVHLQMNVSEASTIAVSLKGFIASVTMP